MHTNLLDFVLTHLDRRSPKWTEVARSTGVPYDTLKKIATRTTPNPGVRHVQVLADYFQAQAQPKPADTLREGTVRHQQTRRAGELAIPLDDRRSNDVSALPPSPLPAQQV